MTPSTWSTTTSPTITALSALNGCGGGGGTYADGGGGAHCWMAVDCARSSTPLRPTADSALLVTSPRCVRLAWSSTMTETRFTSSDFSPTRGKRNLICSCHTSTWERREASMR